ncbi:hypothetical protein NFI96_022071, partial [Prochilodus magdalenae]
MPNHKHSIRSDPNLGFPVHPSMSTSTSWDWIGHVLDTVLGVATSMFRHSYIKELVSWSDVVDAFPGTVPRRIPCRLGLYPLLVDLYDRISGSFCSLAADSGKGQSLRGWKLKGQGQPRTDRCLPSPPGPDSVPQSLVAKGLTPRPGKQWLCGLMASKLRRYKYTGPTTTRPSATTDSSSMSDSDRTTPLDALVMDAEILKSEILLSLKAEISAVIKSVWKNTLTEDFNSLKAELQGVKAEIVSNMAAKVKATTWKVDCQHSQM